MRQLDATIAGVVLIFALAYLDAAWEGTNIAATVVIGPFLTAIFAGRRNTALVAASPSSASSSAAATTTTTGPPTTSCGSRW